MNNSDKHEEKVREMLETIEFDPRYAVNYADKVIDKDEGRDAEAFMLRFAAYAERYREDKNENAKAEALASYKVATRLDSSLELFPHDEYELKGLIGVGSFAYIFRVRPEGRVEDRALKVLKHTKDLDEEAKEKFRNKANYLAECDSESIININDTKGLEEDRPYYTMEYFSKESLREWMERREIGGDNITTKKYLEIINIAKQIAEALCEASEEGILHLDLKPENILVKEETEPGETVVGIADFGFITLQKKGLPRQSLSATEVTIEYSAPEVIENIGKSTEKSDIYSFGLIMSEIILGKNIDRISLSEITRLAHDEPELGVLFLSCRDPDPDNRPENWDEVLESLYDIEDNIRDKKERFENITKKSTLLRLIMDSMGSGFKFVITDLIDIFDKNKVKKSSSAILVSLFIPTIIFVFSKFIHFQEWTIAIEERELHILLVAVTFAFLHLSYYFNFVVHCRFHNSILDKAVNPLMSVSFAPPLILGVLNPQYWPYFASLGVFPIFIVNLFIWRYMSSYKKYAAYFFEHQRGITYTILKGYTFSSMSWVISLLVLGFLMTWDYSIGGINNKNIYWRTDVIISVGVSLMNVVVLFLNVLSESNNRLLGGVSLEYAIRAYRG